jgi:hypothetical protein
MCSLGHAPSAFVAFLCNCTETVNQRTVMGKGKGMSEGNAMVALQQKNDETVTLGDSRTDRPSKAKVKRNVELLVASRKSQSTARGNQSLMNQSNTSSIHFFAVCISAQCPPVAMEIAFILRSKTSTKMTNSAIYPCILHLGVPVIS